MRFFILVTVALSFIIELNAAANNLPLQTSKDVGVENLDSHHIGHRSDNTSAAEYIVWPKDGSNKDAVAKTSDLLKQLTQKPKIYSYTDYKGNLMHWLLNATDSQVQSIKGYDGVARVEQNTIIAEEFASVPVPTEIAKLSEARKVKRDTRYSTQQDAVWELKMVSQPT